MGSRRRKPGDAGRVVAYLRVSTSVERQGLGAEAQRQAVAAWATSQGAEVVGWFVEEVSGGAPLDRRPVLLEAIAATAAHGSGRLVVQRLDRFSRDPLSAALAEAELRRNGASLAVVEGAGGGDAEDPTTALVRDILLSVARFERALTRARIRAALRVKRGRNERLGELPYGFMTGSDGVHVEPEPDEQRVIERARSLADGGMSQRAIAHELGQLGLRSRSGGAFTQTQVSRMLRGRKAAA